VVNPATVALDQDSQDIQQQRLNVQSPVMNDCEVEIVQETQILEETATDKKEDTKPYLSFGVIGLIEKAKLNLILSWKLHSNKSLK